MNMNVDTTKLGAVSPRSAQAETRPDVQETPSTASIVVLIALSIISSVAIILVNKTIVKTYGFRYVLTLTTFHFIVTYAALSVCVKLGVFQRKPLESGQSWKVAALGVASIALMNFSLLANSVGTYQVMKLLCIPAVMLIQFLTVQIVTPTSIKLSLGLLLLGVGVATVTDVSLSVIGLVIGLASVATTAQFQIWQGSKQKQFALSGPQLQLALAPYQAVITGGLALLYDFSGTDSVLQHKFETIEIILILISCVFAVAVNLVSMGLIGKTSPVTYQVVGHVKTCLVLIGGYIFHPVAATTEQFWRNVAGIAVAMCGVIMYSYFKTMALR